MRDFSKFFDCCDRSKNAINAIEQVLIDFPPLIIVIMRYKLAMLRSDTANMESKNVENDRYQNSIDDFLLENGFNRIRDDGKSDRRSQVSQHLKTGNPLSLSCYSHESPIELVNIASE